MDACRETKLIAGKVWGEMPNSVHGRTAGYLLWYKVVGWGVWVKIQIILKKSIVKWVCLLCRQKTWLLDKSSKYLLDCHSKPLLGDSEPSNTKLVKLFLMFSWTHAHPQHQRRERFKLTSDSASMDRKASKWVEVDIGHLNYFKNTFISELGWTISLFFFLKILSTWQTSKENEHLFSSTTMNLLSSWPRTIENLIRYAIVTSLHLKLMQMSVFPRMW